MLNIVLIYSIFTIESINFALDLVSYEYKLKYEKKNADTEMKIEWKNPIFMDLYINTLSEEQKKKLQDPKFIVPFNGGQTRSFTYRQQLQKDNPNPPENTCITFELYNKITKEKDMSVYGKYFIIDHKELKINYNISKLDIYNKNKGRDYGIEKVLINIDKYYNNRNETPITKYRSDVLKVKGKEGENNKGSYIVFGIIDSNIIKNSCDETTISKLTQDQYLFISNKQNDTS